MFRTSFGFVSPVFLFRRQAPNACVSHAKLTRGIEAAHQHRCCIFATDVATRAVTLSACIRKFWRQLREVKKYDRVRQVVRSKA